MRSRNKIKDKTNTQTRTKQYKSTTRNTNTRVYCVRFLLSPFPIVSIYYACCIAAGKFNAHCPTPGLPKLSSTVFKSTHTIKTDQWIQIILWLNTFSPSNSSILELSGVYSLNLLSFLTICYFISMVAILKNNSAIY